MRLTITFDLRNFVQRFPLGTQADVVLVYFTAGIGYFSGEQPAIGQVTVMGNRKSLAAGLFLVIIQPLVKIQRILGAHGGLCRQGYDLFRAISVVAQNHVAVQIEPFRHRGPLETDQGRKLARIIKLIGSISYFVPKVIVNI